MNCKEVAIIESNEIDREEIARRAYELHLHRECGHGRDVEDWLRAEGELIQEVIAGPPKAMAAAAGRNRCN
jgi:DUF2934 family protein